jgi:DNA excision repair protein ERCC-1
MGEDNIDTTSFSNVLAAVSKMRDELMVQPEKDHANKRQKLPERVQTPTHTSRNEALPPRAPKPIISTENINGDNPNVNANLKNSNPYINSNSGISSNTNIPKEYTNFKPVSVPKRLVVAPVNNFQTFNQIQVSRSQTGNPLLEYLQFYQMNSKIKDVDYVINSKCIALFLSLRYHKLHPEYIYNKLKKITYNHEDTLKVLLVYVDVEDFQDTVRELNKLCLFNKLTIILAWTNEQCATYLQNLKYVEKEASKRIIQGNRTDDKEVLANDGKYLERVMKTVSSVKSVSQTDSKSLLARFGSVRSIIAADADGLQGIEGLGPLKVERLLAAFNQPFRSE